MTRLDRTSLSPPWGIHTLPADEELQLAVGPLRIRVRTTGDEIRVAHLSGDWARPGASREPERLEEPSEETDWIRWPIDRPVERIGLVPVFPDRPLVLAPESSFRLLPGGSARIYVRVPLWVALEVGDGEGERLAELPTVILSDTWWGSLTDGELCYWLPTNARREVTAETFTPYQAVCPLALSNRADEELSVEKIALRVEHLSVYEEEGHLWSDETRVKYRGEESGSEIAVSGRPPQEAADAVRVSPARTPIPSRAIHVRTFARIRALSGKGGE